MLFGVHDIEYKAQHPYSKSQNYKELKIEGSRPGESSLSPGSRCARCSYSSKSAARLPATGTMGLFFMLDLMNLVRNL